MSKTDTIAEPTAVPEDGGRRTSRLVRPAGYLAGAALVMAVAGLVFWGWTSLFGSTGKDAVAVPVPVDWQRPVVSAAGLAEASGVQIEHVAITGGGGLLDLRFRVVDPDRAAEVHADVNPPGVVLEKSGLVASELLMGHAHGGPYKQGVTYYLIFENPGNLVQQGNKVTVLLGNAQVEHVVVE